MATSIVRASDSLLALPYHFSELLTRIEPPGERKQIASTIPGDVRDYLKMSAVFPTLHPHSRLTGSHGRLTAIHDIKDVDFVIFVPMGEYGVRPNPADVLDGLFSVLYGLPKALGYEGEATVRRRQRRSVHVHFNEADLHLDVVPALIPETVDEPLLVPDREWNRWIDSHPLGYGKALSKLNNDNDGKVVPLIKLFKHWRTVQMQRRRPKSYYLECLAYRHVSEGRVTTDEQPYAVIFTELLRSVHEEFLQALNGGWVPEIPDPMLGHNLAFNWEREAFETFMSRLSESIRWADRALKKDQDQLDEAIELWQKIFGEAYFVDSATARQRQLTVWSTKRHVSSTGRITSTSLAGASSVAIPKHRFYGDVE